MLLSCRWAYHHLAKTTTICTPFQLVYGLEVILLIECEIPSFKLAIELLPNILPEEERLIYLERLDETRHIFVMVIKAKNKHVKAHFDENISPRTFSEGNLVLSPPI